MIGFNRPYFSGKELENITELAAHHHLSGDGIYTKACQEWLTLNTTSYQALLTNSCTAALEMSALLCRITHGDEVILPSFTFVSTVNAFVLRGAVPRFVDIRKDTLNIDESQLESIISERTKAIVVVHYAGVGAEMDAITQIARKYNLFVIEDAAQGILARYKGRPLGSLGDLGTLSFHETKNIICGEGGSLLINNPTMIERAEILREKGTNRSKFFRGEVDKYTWVDLGSSFLPSEITAAFLKAQLDSAQVITDQRINAWTKYYNAFAEVERKGLARRPFIPAYCTHNAHIFYLILPSPSARDPFIDKMKTLGIQCVSHYQPLHSSPFHLSNYPNTPSLPITDYISSSIVRFPLWLGIETYQDYIIESALSLLDANH